MPEPDPDPKPPERKPVESEQPRYVCACEICKQSLRESERVASNSLSLEL